MHKNTAKPDITVSTTEQWLSQGLVMAVAYNASDPDNIQSQFLTMAQSIHPTQSVCGGQSSGATCRPGCLNWSLSEWTGSSFLSLRPGIPERNRCPAVCMLGHLLMLKWCPRDWHPSHQSAQCTEEPSPLWNCYLLHLYVWLVIQHTFTSKWRCLEEAATFLVVLDTYDMGRHRMGTAGK